MTDNKRRFSKQALTIDEQIELLKKRGLIIEDEQRTKSYLNYIGYYRLSAYEIPYQYADRTNNHHIFFEGTHFQDILDTYTLDRKLRLLVMDAIERIEIAIKSIIINDMCLKYGPHWYMDDKCYISGFTDKRGGESSRFDHLMRTIQKDTEYGKPIGDIKNPCLKHYYTEYNAPALPPLWIAFEVMTFGTVSMMYSNLHHTDQKRMAEKLLLSVKELKSWLHVASHLRNLCAHHSRIWNRFFTFKPVPAQKWMDDFTPNTLFYAQALVLHLLLQRVSPKSQWSDKLKSTLDEYPNISLENMGFKKDWYQRDVWQKTPLRD